MKQSDEKRSTVPDRQAELLSIIEKLNLGLGEYQRCAIVRREMETPPHPLERERLGEIIRRRAFLQIKITEWMKLLTPAMVEREINAAPLFSLQWPVVSPIEAPDAVVDDPAVLPAVQAALESLRSALRARPIENNTEEGLLPIKDLLPKSVKNTAGLYRRACEVLQNDTPTDDEAYDVLKRAHDQTDMQGDDMRFHLPSRETFKRYMRKYRNATDRSKATPKPILNKQVADGTFRSVVPRSSVE